MKYPVVPFELSAIAQERTLMEIGFSYSEIKELDCDKADLHIALHQEIKQYEEDEIKKSSKVKR